MYVFVILPVLFSRDDVAKIARRQWPRQLPTHPSAHFSMTTPQENHLVHHLTDGGHDDVAGWSSNDLFIEEEAIVNGACEKKVRIRPFMDVCIV